MPADRDPRVTPARRFAGAREGARRLLARVRERAQRLREAAEERTERARERSPAVERGFHLVRRDRERLGTVLAGAVAYRLFLWLLPFALLVVGLLGLVDRLDPGAAESGAEQVGLGGVLADAINDGASESGWWIALLTGLSGTVYAGIGATRALVVSHAAAWGTRPPRRRPGLAASIALGSVASGVLAVTLLIGWVRHESAASGLAATALLTVVWFVLWLRISVRLPHGTAPVRALVPGAVIVAVGVQGLHLLSVYYLAGQAERSASVYGGIGTALTLLLWLFIVARLMVAGAVVNAELWSERAGPAQAPADDDGGGVDDGAASRSRATRSP